MWMGFRNPDKRKDALYEVAKKMEKQESENQSSE